MNILYKGDCLELLPKNIPDKSIDMILADLPYGTTRNSWDTPIDLKKTKGHKPMNSGMRHSGQRNTIYGRINEKPLPFGGNTDRFPRSVLVFSSDKQKNYKHSTQKPLALIEYLIKTYTNEGDTVLDNVAGSGVVGIGCINLNRKYILMEKDLAIYIEQW